jgi:hypothetical protein
VKREGKMVMINDVMALLRSENYGDHMLAQEFGAFRVSLLAPMLSFGLHLPQADGDLCRVKFRDRDWIKKRLTYVGHRHRLILTKPFDSSIPGFVMSGRRPLIKGYFAALRLIVGAVMSSAC